MRCNTWIYQELVRLKTWKESLLLNRRVMSQVWALQVLIILGALRAGQLEVLKLLVQVRLMLVIRQEFIVRQDVTPDVTYIKPAPLSLWLSERMLSSHFSNTTILSSWTTKMGDCQKLRGLMLLQVSWSVVGVLSTWRLQKDLILAMQAKYLLIISWSHFCAAIIISLWRNIQHKRCLSFSNFPRLLHARSIDKAHPTQWP